MARVSQGHVELDDVCDDTTPLLVLKALRDQPGLHAEEDGGQIVIYRTYD